MKDWLDSMIQFKEKLLPLGTVDCYFRKYDPAEVLVSVKQVEVIVRS